MPDGIRKTDVFFGDVQTYRNQVVAIQTGAAADGVTSVSFLVKYQGCADVGVCYPPHKKTITIALPSDSQTDTAALNLDTKKSAGLFGDTKVTTDSLPLPAEQAFQFEAIVNTSNELLLRFTPAPGYYLYRDKTKVNIVSDENRVVAGDIQWPTAQLHKDEYFGESAVFFDLVTRVSPAGSSPA